MREHTPEPIKVPLTETQVTALGFNPDGSGPDCFVGMVARSTHPDAGKIMLYVIPTTFARANRANRAARGLPLSEPRKKAAARPAKKIGALTP